MKNTKTLKLLVMVLSLVLLMSAAIAVAVSAAEDDTYAIKSINISHDDSIMVLMAVDAVGVDPATIEVKYTIGNGEAKTAKYYKNVAIYKNLGDETEYPVFYTEGIPMKDMGEDVKAEAHKVGTTPAAPQYKDISVATYLYTKLAKEGYIAATEGEDLGRKNLYLNLLSYGAQAQKVLWNNKHPEALRTLVTDINAVYVGNNVVVDGQSGLTKLDSLGRKELTYTGSGILLGYNVSDANGTKYYRSDSVYLTGISKVTPVIATGETTLTFNEEYVEDTSGALNKLTFTESGVVVSGGGTNVGLNGVIAKATIETEANGNKYLNIVSPGRGGASSDRGHGIQTQVAKALTEDANVVVLSFDIRGTGTSGAIELVLRPAPSPYAQFNEVCALALKGNTEWTNYRLEYYDEQDVVQLYINGVYQKNLTPNIEGAIAKLGSDIYANINGYNDSAFDIDIDNLAIYKTTKAYEAVPSNGYITETFDAGWEYGVFSGSCAATPEKNQEVKAAGGLIYSKMDSTSRTNEGKTFSEVVNKDGNSYLRTYSPGRDGVGTNRAHSFYFTPESLVDNSFVNTTVVEMDIKADALCSNTEGLTLAFNAADGKYLRYCCNTSGNFVKAGLKFVNMKEWTRVKFVVDYANKLIELYVNNEFIGNLTYDNTDLVNMSADWANVKNAPFASFNIFTYNGGGAVDVSIDNVAFYHTYVAK